VALRREINAAGLELEAIENFDPAHWHDILLDGPKKKQQMRTSRLLSGGWATPESRSWATISASPGSAGARARSLRAGRGGIRGMEGPLETPMPKGMVWNMVYDPAAPEGCVPAVSHEELWRRFGEFLREIIPVAEESGVRLAAHPDDPPMPTCGASRAWSIRGC